MIDSEMPQPPCLSAKHLHSRFLTFRTPTIGRQRHRFAGRLNSSTPGLSRLPDRSNAPIRKAFEGEMGAAPWPFQVMFKDARRTALT
jgi:hypothetical protein